MGAATRTLTEAGATAALEAAVSGAGTDFSHTRSQIFKEKTELCRKKRCEQSFSSRTATSTNSCVQRSTTCTSTCSTKKCFSLYDNKPIIIDKDRDQTYSRRDGGEESSVRRTDKAFLGDWAELGELICSDFTFFV